MSKKSIKKQIPKLIKPKGVKSIKKELPSIVSILGENIRMIRKQNNKSIEEVAFKAEIDAQNLRKYELGKQEMKIGMLKRIALALDMSMSELLKIVESKQEA